MGGLVIGAIIKEPLAPCPLPYKAGGGTVEELNDSWLREARMPTPTLDGDVAIVIVVVPTAGAALTTKSGLGVPRNCESGREGGTTLKYDSSLILGEGSERGLVGCGAAGTVPGGEWGGAGESCRSFSWGAGLPTIGLSKTGAGAGGWGNPPLRLS